MFHFFQTSDAIIFSTNIWQWEDNELPAKRFPWQHYIAYTYESAKSDSYR